MSDRLEEIKEFLEQWSDEGGGLSPVVVTGYLLESFDRAYGEDIPYLLQRLQGAEKIVRDLAKGRYKECGTIGWCFHCSTYFVMNGHDPTCPYRRAVEWVEKEEASSE